MSPAPKYSLPTPLAVGDLIICGGHSRISKIIRQFTDHKNHAVSHCAVMLSSTTLAESTSLNGENGVNIEPFEYWLEDYPGEVWVKYLSKDVEGQFDSKRFANFVISQDGRPYDKIQAFFAAFGLNKPDSWGDSKWYCSELACAAYKEGGVIPVNYESGITPYEMMELPIFDKKAWQVKGSPKELK